MKKLSIVVPAFNEEANLVPFVEAIDLVLGGIDEARRPKTEFVFVDDGSRDGTLSKLRELSDKDNRIHYLSFSRNFGKEAALAAGLDYVAGPECDTSDYIVTMDADLQHDPKHLIEMFEALESGEYESAAVCRKARNDEPKLRGFLATHYYRLMSRYSEVPLKNGSMDYRMMTRGFVKAVLSLKERGRFTKGIYQWVGFRTKWIETETEARAAGESKWTLESLFAYAINSIIAFSSAPLKIASVVGVFCFLVSFAYICYCVLRWVCFDHTLWGMPTFICVFMMLSGIQLFVIGILGLYISGIFRETKNRPLYIVKESK